MEDRKLYELRIEGVSTPLLFLEWFEAEVFIYRLRDAAELAGEVMPMISIRGVRQEIAQAEGGAPDDNL